jgi:hypothetical protein
MAHLPVPHNARLDRPIEPGQLVVIRGRMLEVDLKGQDGEEKPDPRMTINFAASGQGYDSATIPMQLGFRFKDKDTVLNTKDNGEWDKQVNKKLPFKLGEEFDIRIRCLGDKYEVFIDRVHFVDYEHIKPLTQVSHIFIDGPCILEKVNWGGKFYNVPYESGISTGFGPGRKLVVSGLPDKDCKTFHINLLTKQGDIALHLNPRFNDKAIIRNTEKDGEWQKEEREGKFTMQKKEVFDIAIVNEEYSLQILVNGEQFCAYAHRCDPNEINGLQIEGDITILSIQVLQA